MSTQPLGPKPETDLDSNIMEVDLMTYKNNDQHHTKEMTLIQLVVRRGQHFTIGMKFKIPFQPQTHNLTFTASTGDFADEDRGTKSRFGIPDFVKRSPQAKAIWKAEFTKKEDIDTEKYGEGWVFVDMTPPADAPVGIYHLSVNFLGKDTDLGQAALLFNPWFPADAVYMAKEGARDEYVMNETGVIFRGSGHHIAPSVWNFGQFENDMVEIIFHLLHINPNHIEDPGKDEGAWSDPGYVGRVISAMINSNGDYGVLVGRWDGNYYGMEGEQPPTHWSDSHSILYQWLKSEYRPVKYGQCWVFAAVMCSVMRALGVPCRVITNFQSAHDTNMNLIIDEYHADYGVPEIQSADSVWNFHVWVECWMKRPDLLGLDGWQVLDPTPQELSGGAFQCGPAPVKAVLEGKTDEKYDVPFVFAEVNADCVDWLVKADGSKTRIITDTKRVGMKISTKAIGSNRRKDVTSHYKHKEGTEKERAVFRYAVNIVDSSDNNVDFDSDESDEEPEEPEPEPPTELPEISLKFVEVTDMVNGKDVQVNLVIHSEAIRPRNLSIHINVKAKTYTGTDNIVIQALKKNGTLLPGKELVIPVFVSFSKYWRPMLDHDVMKFSAIISDNENSEDTFMAQRDVVLADPPMAITGQTETQVFRVTPIQIYFPNPVSETLTNCTLTLSGSGLLHYEKIISVPDLPPNRGVRVKVECFPYKSGKKVLVADFNCSVFRDIKKSFEINVGKNSRFPWL